MFKKRLFKMILIVFALVAIGFIVKLLSVNYNKELSSEKLQQSVIQLNTSNEKLNKKNKEIEDIKHELDKIKREYEEFKDSANHKLNNYEGINNILINILKEEFSKYSEKEIREKIEKSMEYSIYIYETNMEWSEIGERENINNSGVTEVEYNSFVIGVGVKMTDMGYALASTGYMDSEFFDNIDGPWLEVIDYEKYEKNESAGTFVASEMCVFENVADDMKINVKIPDKLKERFNFEDNIITLHVQLKE